MRRAAPIVCVLILAAGLAACGGPRPPRLTGYVEAEYLYISPRDPGLVSQILVKEGDSIALDAPLFVMDDSRVKELAAQGEASQAAAQARALDVRTGKPLEIAALAEAVRQARANSDLANANLARTQALFDKALLAQARLDQDRAAAEAAKAALRRAEAEYRAAAAPNRQADVRAAREEARAAAANARLLETQRRQLAMRAPVAARVERIYRRPGEFAQPGEPVVALLPPQNLKVRFYAPQPMLHRLALGQEIKVDCDGCDKPAAARVSFIAAEPHFTPPVIFSEKQRDQLVFLIEARLAPTTLHPGQPVDVTLAVEPKK